MRYLYIDIYCTLNVYILKLPLSILFFFLRFSCIMYTHNRAREFTVFTMRFVSLLFFLFIYIAVFCCVSVCMRETKNTVLLDSTGLIGDQMKRCGVFRFINVCFHTNKRFKSNIQQQKCAAQSTY